MPDPTATRHNRPARTAGRTNPCLCRAAGESTEDCPWKCDGDTKPQLQGVYRSGGTVTRWFGDGIARGILGP